MRDVARRLGSRLPVSTRGWFELAFFVAQLCLILLHLVLISAEVDHLKVVIAYYAQILPLDALEDLLLLLGGGTHVVGHVRCEVIGYGIGGLNDSTDVELGLDQLLLC